MDWSRDLSSLAGDRTSPLLYSTMLAAILEQTFTYTLHNNSVQVIFWKWGIFIIRFKTLFILNNIYFTNISCSRRRMQGTVLNLLIKYSIFQIPTMSFNSVYVLENKYKSHSNHPVYFVVFRRVSQETFSDQWLSESMAFVSVVNYKVVRSYLTVVPISSISSY